MSDNKEGISSGGSNYEVIPMNEISLLRAMHVSRLFDSWGEAHAVSCFCPDEIPDAIRQPQAACGLGLSDT